MKMKRIAFFLSMMLMISASALAERKTTQASIDLRFGDETYTSKFEVSWDEQDDGVVILPLTEADSFFLVNKDGVRLRTTYSLNSAAKTVLDKGEPVQATRKYSVGGEIWYYITVKKSSGNVYSGYVCASVLDKVSKQTFIENGGNINLDADIGEILGMIRVTANDVSIRKEADSNSEKVAVANKGDVFFYLGKSGNWYQIQSGYWIKNTYAAVMSESEVDDYLNSGDYAGETYREGAPARWSPGFRRRSRSSSITMATSAALTAERPERLFRRSRVTMALKQTVWPGRRQLPG